MNPLLGVFFHWLGGLASGSFYVPYKGVKRWSWETYWLVGGVFSWLIAPWFFAFLKTTDVATVLRETPGDVWFYTYLFGVLWGFGGLTFGLTMRYLGMSLGMAVALGYCTVFGTLIPPIFAGEFTSKLIEPVNGQWVLAGLGVCVLGIIITALAGRAKERGMSAADKRDTVKEFNFKTGMLVATFSGIMSACFAFGLSAGDPIRAITLKVDMVNSAAAAGISVIRASEPAPAEVSQMVDALARAGLIKDAAKPDLGDVLGILDAPARATPAAEESAELAQARKTAATARNLLGASDSPLARRLAGYASAIAAPDIKPEVLAIVTGLPSLSEKETALAMVAAGADLPGIHARHSLWTGLPVLIVVLLGGFTTNFLWCVILNVRNRTAYQYFSPKPGEMSPPAWKADGTGETDGRKDPTPVPLLGNYLFSALAGTIWYFQFFFYSMGETQMGDYKFSSWTLHMASIIIFSSIWGLALNEWKGASPRAKSLLFLGLAVLVLSTLVVGYGNLLASKS